MNPKTKIPRRARRRAPQYSSNTNVPLETPQPLNSGPSIVPIPESTQAVPPPPATTQAYYNQDQV